MIQYSKAIYGSIVRNDSDKYSDKDLIIVAESYAILNKLKKIYDTSQWSVAYYTYSKLRRISKKGGLFIQHLKNESEILMDDNEKLSTILKDFKAKEEYASDIESSYVFFNHFKFHLHSPQMNGWICDVLYVGLRNLLIYKHAQIGEFQFSYLKLLNHFSDVLSDTELQTLKELRVVKRNYRNKISDELPCNGYVVKVYDILVKLKILDSYHILSLDNFQNKVLQELESNTAIPYCKLRLFEGLYTSTNSSNELIEKIITNPQMYTFNFINPKYIANLIKCFKVSDDNIINASTSVML